MKLTLYKKIWIIYLLSLIVVLPVLMNISEDYENVDTTALVFLFVLMFYVIGGVVVLVFAHLLTVLKKQSIVFEEKIKQKPEKYYEIKKIRIVIYSIGSMLSLFFLVPILFFDLSDENKMFLVLVFSIISIVLLGYLYLKELKI